MLQLLSIGTADFHIGITLLHNAKDVLIKAEKHDSLERRKYLVLHVCQTSLLIWEAKTIERKHVTLIKVLERDDCCLCVGNKFDTLETIIHQVGFPQSLP